MTQNTVQVTDFKTAINRLESELGEPLSSSNAVMVQTRKPQFSVSMANKEDFIKIATQYLGVESIKPEDVTVITLDSLGAEKTNKMKFR